MRLHYASLALLGAFVVPFAAGCGSSTASGESPLDAAEPRIDAHHAPDAQHAPDAAKGPPHDAAPGQITDGGAKGAPDSGADTAAPLDAAPPAIAPYPQVANFGGTVMTAPKIQLIAYSEDPVVPDVEGFITQFGSTTEWATQTAEYGVGAFTALPPILIPGTPPTTLDDNTGNTTPFEQTLITNTTGANPAWGAADSGTIYMFLLPTGTNISSRGSCCTDFLGYHYETAAGSTPLAYGVVCDCPAEGGGLTSLELTTTTVSHEMVEAATDPFPNTSPAYAYTDDADAVWSYVTGGEVADMCEYNLDSNYTPPGDQYMLQRSWSDMAAKAGKNPCVPLATTDPYFNSYAIYDDPLVVAQNQQTTGVKLAVGATKTIDVVLSSEAPTAGPWTVTAWDMNDYLGYTPNLTVTLDKPSGSSGDVLHLTITVNSYDSQFGGAGFILESTLNGQDNLTMVAVGN